MKKQVALGIIALSFLSVLLSMSFASAFWSELGDGDLTGAFNSIRINVGSVDTVWSVQVLLFFLVFIVVFGVGDYIPFIGSKNWLNFAFSIIIAILATMYLRSEEIYAILGSYKALGVVITAVIPFFIIAAISKKAHEKGQFMLGRGLWIAFVIVLLYIVLFVEHGDGNFGWLYLIILALSVLMFFLEGTFYMWLMRKELKDGLSMREQGNVAHLIAKIEELKEQLIYADDKTSEKLAERIKELEKRLSHFKK